MKNRHLKTIYERFSHHKVQDLKEFQKEISQKIKTLYDVESKQNLKNNINKNIDLWELLLKYNINIDGTFYMKGLGEPGNVETHYANGELLPTPYEKDGKWVDGKWIGYYDRCDAYYFQEYDTPLPRVTLKDGKEYVAFKVLASDFENNSLVIYKSKDFNLFETKITNSNPRNCEVLLEGNIGYYIK